MNRIRLLTTVAVLLIAAATGEAAPPVWNYSYPAGVQRGQEAEVALSGTFGKWPVTVVVDRPGLTIEVLKKKGQLKVTAADDAAGIFWVRLHDAEGALTMRPLLVGGIREVLEKEPNDDPAAPQKLDDATTINGKLAKSGDVDGFAITLKQGQTLVAAMTANRWLAAPMDAVLQVCSPQGLVLAQNDDGGGLDPLLVFQAPSDDTYVVRTFAFPATPNSTIGLAGGDSYVYRLTVTAGEYLDHVLPMATSANGSGRELSSGHTGFGWNLPDDKTTVEFVGGGDRQPAWAFRRNAAGLVPLPLQDGTTVVAPADCSLDQPFPLTNLPAAISGRLDRPKQGHAIAFEAKKGKTVSLRLESRSLGFPLDAVLEVFDATGKSLMEKDDASRAVRDPLLQFKPPADGTYRVTIRDLHDRGGERFVYRLEVAPASPSFTLKLANDALVVEPGKSVEVEVTVQRSGGFAGEIDIQAERLPDGVTCQVVKSAAKGDTAKKVKLKLLAAKDAKSGAFQVIGKSAQNPTQLARFDLPGHGFSHYRAWVTVK